MLNLIFFLYIHIENPYKIDVYTYLHKTHNIIFQVNNLYSVHRGIHCSLMIVGNKGPAIRSKSNYRYRHRYDNEYIFIIYTTWITHPLPPVSILSTIISYNDE